MDIVFFYLVFKISTPFRVHKLISKSMFNYTSELKLCYNRFYKGVIFLKIGYARVSTGLQNLDLQEDSLNKFGCEKIFTDHMSGAKSNRPGLETAIDFVRSGDTLVVWRLDRLGRNMEDLISIVNRLNERGVSFHSLQENITMDKSSSTGQLMFHLFAAFAEFERNLILERSAAGRAAARSKRAIWRSS